MAGGRPQRILIELAALGLLVPGCARAGNVGDQPKGVDDCAPSCLEHVAVPPPRFTLQGTPHGVRGKRVLLARAARDTSGVVPGDALTDRVLKVLRSRRLPIEQAYLDEPSATYVVLFRADVSRTTLDEARAEVARLPAVADVRLGVAS